MIIVSKKRYDDLTEAHSRLQQQLQHVRAQLCQQKDGLSGRLADLKTKWDLLRRQTIADLDRNSEQIVTGLAECDTARYAAWHRPEWGAWHPEGSPVAYKLRVGDLVHKDRYGSRPIPLPHLIEFIGTDRTFVYQCTRGTRDDALERMHAAILRIACLMPHDAKFTLLDPAGLGHAFPMRKELPRTRPPSDDVYQVLRNVQNDILQINEGALGVRVQALHELPQELRANHGFEFIFLADFPDPQGYDRRTIEILQKISRSGPRAGRYLFIHHNTDIPMPRDLSLDGFANPTDVSAQLAQEPKISDTSFVPDRAPDADRLEQVCARIREAIPPEVNIDWASVVDVPEDRWWTGSSTDRIETPIGRSEDGTLLSFCLGANADDRPCTHGMLAATTGFGKSNLYHVLIVGLTLRYSPEELRLYLIDGKDGVEFEPYRTLPHAEVVSLRSQPELSRSVLRELIDEKEWRNETFAKTGASSFNRYRKLGSPSGTFPRILLLVDEYQELFEDDRAGEASNWLADLASQGRSAGIHMFLASQRFGAAGMLRQKDIMGNTHLRMAMKLSEDDVAAVEEFGRKGRERIKKCNMPGLIVINDQAGNDTANVSGRVARITEEQHGRQIEKLIEYAKTRVSDRARSGPIVFDGRDQPSLANHPILCALIDRRASLSDAELEAFAHANVRSVGAAFEVLGQFPRSRDVAS